MKKIAVIGAGWTGLGILRILKEKGFVIDVYEGNNDVGGTWHPDNCYAGLKIHNMAFTVIFPDFPLPEHVDPYERISSAQIFDYLKNYCRHFNLYENISLNSRCEKIFYNTETQKHSLLINKKSTTYQTEEYDYVIFTHGFTERKIPEFKGADSFAGTIYHSFEVNEQEIKKMILENKKIAVIGGSKTATDFILAFYNFGYKVNWICREPYWFYNFSFQKDLLMSLHKSLGTKLKRWLFLSGFLFLKTAPLVSYGLWKSLGSIHSYGSNRFNLKKFHAGLLDQGQIDILQSYYSQYAIESEIESICKEKLTLKNGKQVDADIIICCTGSGPKQLPQVQINGSTFDLTKAELFYRNAVIPELPHLIFTAYLPFGFGIGKALLVANWIEKYIEFAPNAEYLAKHAMKHDIGFLLSHPLFNSNHAFLVQGMDQLEDFIKNGELTRSAYVRWFNASLFSGEAAKPINFNIPKAKK